MGGLVRYLLNYKIDSVLLEEGFASEIAVKDGVPVVRTPKIAHYDFISAIEVFEHLLDPVAAIELIAKAIKPGGILLITTGNLSKHKGPIAKWYYAKLNPDVHITFFTPRAMSTMLEEYGFVKLKSKFNYRIILYKVLKNLFMLSIIKNNKSVKQIIWKFRIFIIPLLPLVDKRFGVSEQGLYMKGY